MSKKLAEKAGLIKLPPLSERRNDPGHDLASTGPGQASPAPADARSRTAPGTMAAFLGTQSAAIKESEDLRGRLQAFEGATPARRIDPRLVRASQWANRIEASFGTKEFEDLKAEIANAGGNVQPVKVRRLAGAKEEYELIYGHRRHRACLQLGLQVFALIEDIDDNGLFLQMERENRQRKDLSAWEQGQMYARALEKGLFPSNRKLAEAIGRDLGDVGKALTLGRLPREIVDAFASPLDLQFRFAKPLGDAYESDPAGILARAKDLARLTPRLPAKEVLAKLLGRGAAQDTHAPMVLSKNSVPVATVSKDSRGSITIQIPTKLDAAKESKLVELLRKLLGTDA